MKKLVYGVLAIAAIGMFAACQKDGKYNPKEKIANVYEEGMSIWSYTPDGEQWVSDTSITPKYLSERWTWDGNELSQITFIEQSYVYDWENDTYTEQTYEDVVKFTYAKPQATVNGWCLPMTARSFRKPNCSRTVRARLKLRLLLSTTARRLAGLR